MRLIKSLKIQYPTYKADNPLIANMIKRLMVFKAKIAFIGSDKGKPTTDRVYHLAIWA